MNDNGQTPGTFGGIASLAFYDTLGSDTTNYTVTGSAFLLSGSAFVNLNNGNAGTVSLGAAGAAHGISAVTTDPTGNNGFGLVQTAAGETTTDLLVARRVALRGGGFTTRTFTVSADLQYSTTSCGGTAQVTPSD